MPIIFVVVDSSRSGQRKSARLFVYVKETIESNIKGCRFNINSLDISTVKLPLQVF